MSDTPIINFQSEGGFPQKVAEHLTSEIRKNRLKSGEKLPPEAELCKHYGVSRTVIREALARLKHDGLLESRQGSGIIVASWKKRRSFRLDWLDLQDPYNINFLYELRVFIGVEAASLAAIRHKRADIERLNALMEDMAQAIKKGEDGAIPHRAFHKLIVEASYNPYFIEFESFIQDRLWDVMQQARKRTQTTEGLAPKVHKEHSLVVEAIASGSPELAREAALNHLLNAAKRAGLRIKEKL